MNSTAQSPLDSLKNLVKSTPIIADIYLYLKYPYCINVYKGVYNTFQEAQKAIPQQFHAGYDQLAAHYKKKSDLYLMRPINLPLLAPLKEALVEVSSILDVGGGVGIDYYAFKQVLDFSNSLRWLVYDVPAALEVGQSLAAENQCSNLYFINDFKDASTVDLLLTNGALQYLEPSLSTLLDQLSQKPKYLLINYVPCFEGETFFTVQNLGIARCPYKIQNRSELISGLENQGYQLLKTWKESRNCCVPFHPQQFVNSYFGFYFKRCN